MVKLILLLLLTLALALSSCSHDTPLAEYIYKPFTYTVILKEVDYTNGMDWENGIKTRTPFKCPLYYVDSLGIVEEICPENGASNTITILHSQDFLELVHSIRGFDFLYYRLNSGDTLYFHYEDGIPIAENSEQNLYLNLLTENPYEKLMDRYYLEIPGPNMLYNKYKTKDEFPPELKGLLIFYRNLDSLYSQIKKSYTYQIDYVRNTSDSPDYWEGIVNKEMRRLVLRSFFIDDSDLNLYGKESDFDIYSISDRYYYKAKFNQNPDSIFNTIQNHGPTINPELARYYYQLYLKYFVDRGEPLKDIKQLDFAILSIIFPTPGHSIYSGIKIGYGIGGTYCRRY